MERYLRISRLYWRYHRRWYIRTGKRMPSRLGRRENRQVHETARDPEQLPFLVEALVATAPSAKDLPLIGIDVLEETYRSIGSDAFEAFSKARLLPEHRRLILSGVWPSTLRRAGLADPRHADDS